MGVTDPVGETTDATAPDDRSGWMARTARSTLGSVRFLMIASGTAFILVVNALIGYGIHKRHAESVEAAEQATRDLARTLEEQTLRTVFGVDLMLSDLGLTLELHPAGHERASPSVHAHLKERRGVFPQIADLVVVDESGHVLHHTADAPLPGFALTDRSYFSIHLTRPETGLHVGGPIASRVVAGTQVIPMSRRWSDAGGRLIGVLVAMVDPFRLSATFETLRLDRKGGVILALEDGTILLQRWRGDAAPLARLADWPAVTGALQQAGVATLRAVAPDGRDSIVSIQRVRDYPFVVITTLPRAAALAEWQRDSMVWAAIGLVMTLVIAVLTGFVVRQQVRRDIDQERLNHASRRIRGILDSMIDAVITMDGRGRIETFNPAAQRMFGYAEAELVGRDAWLLIPDDQQAQFRTHIAEHRTRHGGPLMIPAVRDLLAVRRDGTTFPISLSVSELRLPSRRGPGRRNGQSARLYVGVVRDETRRRQQEAELLASKTQAEMANRAKSQFLANMSHELRTPLNAIIGFAEILDSEFFGKLNERQKSCAKDIHDSGRHLLEIVNAVLDMSRIESGHYELHEEAVDFDEALTQCLMMVRDRARETGLDLQHSSTVMGDLWVDRRALKQIILNLLSNAVKFTPAGGSVTVAARLDEDGGVILTVSDTGIGIPAAFLPHLFEPFRQAETTANRRYEGTGLGLSISYTLATLHGGSLSCRSEVGVGTEMTLRLPASRVIAPSAGVGEGMTVA